MHIFLGTARSGQKSGLGLAIPKGEAARVYGSCTSCYPWFDFPRKQQTAYIWAHCFFIVSLLFLYFRSAIVTQGKIFLTSMSVISERDWGEKLAREALI